MGALGCHLRTSKTCGGHVSGLITTRYSAAEVGQLMGAMEMHSHQSPTVSMLRVRDMSNKKALVSF